MRPLSARRNTGGGTPGRPRPVVPPVPVARAVVDIGIYVDGRRLPGRFDHTQALQEVRARGEGFVWIGLHAPDERQMSSLAVTYGLHPLMVEDAVHAHQRPKLERYDDTLFLVLKTVTYVEHETIEAASEVVDSGEIMIIVGENFVIAVRHGEHTELTGVRRTLEASPDLLALGPCAVMHAIADHVVDTYLEVADAIEDDVDAVESTVFAPKRKIEVDPIYLLKREVVELRRAIDPLAKPLERVTSQHSDIVPKEIRRYFRDVLDHHTVVAERVGTYDDVLSSLLAAALAKVGLQQNTDMRKITAWVAMASFPTMLAGIYGMNFEHMPELGTEYGYYVVLSAMVVVVILLFRNFRRNHWL